MVKDDVNITAMESTASDYVKRKICIYLLLLLGRTMLTVVSISSSENEPRGMPVVRKMAQFLTSCTIYKQVTISVKRSKYLWKHWEKVE